MAMLKILGSCSGTEPMPGRRHTSLVLTAGDRNYFFDAGENCSIAAHLDGIDLLKTRAIFISHTHYDHIGGLAGLFWTVRKLAKVRKAPVADGELRLFIPDTAAWDSIYSMLRLTEGGFKHSIDIRAEMPRFGLTYEDENLRVFGFESHHLPAAEDGHCRAYSYRMEVGKKSIVFSGDIKDMNDLIPTVGDGCDLLLCETGHHTVQAVCDFADSHNVGRLVFIHHGREILYNQPTVETAINACRTPVTLAYDGLTIEIE